VDSGGVSTYQWLRCTAAGLAVPTCIPLPGATTTTYVPTVDDISSYLEARQTVTNEGGPTSQTTNMVGIAGAAGACSNPRRGTAGNDTLTGTLWGDRLDGLGGNDVLDGKDGADCLTGGPGNDTVVGGRGNDNLAGGPGRDKLDGGPDNDVLNAGAGKGNVLRGGTGNDTLKAVNHKKDKLDGGKGKDTCRGDRIDIFRSCEHRRVV
jgi:Ca2+-binding RTX toxin-like protein